MTRLLPLVALGLTACAIHAVKPELEMERVQLADAFDRSGAGSPQEGRWWAVYADPALERAVDNAVKGNLNLAAAFQRVEQAGALVRQAGAAWWPSVDVSVGATRTRTNIYTGDFLPDEASGLVDDSGGPKGIEVGSYPMSVAATYEVDLWGRLGHSQGSAKAQARAGALDAAAMVMTVRAQVVDLWFALAEADALRALIHEQIATAVTYLDLTSERFARGQASALDVRQQRRELAALRAELPLIEAQHEVLAQQLAVLSGRAPQGALDAELPGAALPEAPAVPDVGVPAELLRRRPDLLAHEAQVRAADHEVGVALANRFPSLRLTASTGYQDRELGEAFGAWVWNLAGNLTAPIFDAGRRKAEVERRKSVLTERLRRYEQAALQAMAEVEEALAREARQRQHLAALDVQLVEARATLDEARARYLGGLVDYLPVLGALKSVHATERARVRAHRTLLSYGVQLARALGGGWTSTPDTTAQHVGAP